MVQKLEKEGVERALEHFLTSDVHDLLHHLLVREGSVLQGVEVVHQRRGGGDHGVRMRPEEVHHRQPGLGGIHKRPVHHAPHSAVAPCLRTRRAMVNMTRKRTRARVWFWRHGSDLEGISNVDDQRVRAGLHGDPLSVLEHLQPRDGVVQEDREDVEIRVRRDP
jgi:hypothetical protein